MNWQARRQNVRRFW